LPSCLPFFEEEQQPKSKSAFQCCRGRRCASAGPVSEQHEPVGRSLRVVARHAPKPRKYEMMIVVAPTVTEEGLPAVVERVSGLIETHNGRSEEHTSELQSRENLVCRLLLEKKN